MDMIQELKVFAKHQKVLLVEDDKKLNQQTARLLKNFFPVVRRALDGAQALDLCRKEKYDLIITDIRMPNMDGIEFSKAIKDKNQKQAIIVMSAYEESKYFIDLINIGIDGFILKPYDLDIFLKTVLRICENEAHKKEFEKEKIKKIVKALTTGHTETQEMVKSKIDRKLDTLADIAINSISTEEKDENSTSASEMLDNLNSDDGLYLALKQAINEFMDLNGDFEDSVNALYVGDITSEKIEDICVVLRKFHGVFLDIEAFDGVASVLSGLADTLEDVNVESLDDEQKKAMEILEFIQQDIKNFIDQIFIDKKAKDVNYFTDSLKMSINDIEVKLGLKEEEFGDVDFF
jgi:YesN/AraC family two-component response regulator